MKSEWQVWGCRPKAGQAFRAKNGDKRAGFSCLVDGEWRASFKTLSGTLWIVIRSGEGKKTEGGDCWIWPPGCEKILILCWRLGGFGPSPCLSQARLGPSKVSVNYLLFWGPLKFRGRLPLPSVGDTPLEQGDRGRVGIGVNRFLVHCRVTYHLGLPGTEDLQCWNCRVPNKPEWLVIRL